ncbi:hypothetical protein [Hyphobacterium marinum]|uniref:Type II secretion system protein GspC N-terminal domain-containing protein n=1 Tax=Hyphobacterium marinum TaxID=3116574 RepID=A0ABU7LW28_9PROT|nr:hypothetical protein [Hyphobacterium sp. Y6023]MEE2565719.1 hypothetical protein [Hyphobacterium sp. Y6023]
MNRRTLILLGVAGVLAVVFVLDQVRRAGGNDIAQPVRRTAEVEIAQETGPFLPDFSSFAAIAQRPLFRPDRRPEPEPVVTIPDGPVTPIQSSDNPPDFIVVGVVTGPEGRGAATVRDGTETRRVYAGDTVQGWRVDTINRDGIVVTRDGQRWSLPIGEPED